MPEKASKTPPNNSPPEANLVSRGFVISKSLTIVPTSNLALFKASDFLN